MRYFIKAKLHENDHAIEMPIYPDVGVIYPESMLSHDHAGWLECNGQAISRDQYAELFAKIGIRFGEGDHKTTFNLPNFTNSN